MADCAPCWASHPRTVFRTVRVRLLQSAPFPPCALVPKGSPSLPVYARTVTRFTGPLTTDAGLVGRPLLSPTPRGRGFDGRFPRVGLRMCARFGVARTRAPCFKMRVGAAGLPFVDTLFPCPQRHKTLSDFFVLPAD